ncbi:MAG TPA: hypothetical protein VI386_30930, partial [Candidatus Sulfotelmatobacter sp.]
MYRKSISIVLVTGLVLLAGVGDILGDENSPKASFDKRIAASRRFTQTFDRLTDVPNIPEVAHHFDRYLGESVPKDAAELSRWSDYSQSPGGSDLPLLWNDGTKKFEVPRES